MNARAAITVHRDRDEIRRLWDRPEYRAPHIAESGAAVTFKTAPGDRGTEIHVDLGERGGLTRLLRRSSELAKVKDDLRRFKQLVETGVVARSEGAPEGESAARKLKQRPAQPLPESELEKAGVG